jgi:hypothetical protein
LFDNVTTFLFSSFFFWIHSFFFLSLPFFSALQTQVGGLEPGVFASAHWGVPEGVADGAVDKAQEVILQGDGVHRSGLFRLSRRGEGDV